MNPLPRFQTGLRWSVTLCCAAMLAMIWAPARSQPICPSGVTGCSYGEKPFALCEDYHGWLGAIAGMTGKTFCVVNEEELDASTKRHFQKNCTRFTPCRALPPGATTDDGKGKQQFSAPVVVAGPFLKKPSGCPAGSFLAEAERTYSTGEKVPVWYCFKQSGSTK